MTRSAPRKHDLLSSITNFGALLRYLRQRVHLTQRELALATGYSFSQISRLEQNGRLPDEMTLLAVFVPALGLEQEPETVDRLLALARSARGGADASPTPPEPNSEKALPNHAAPVAPGELLANAQVLPDFSVFYGRQSELRQLKQWIVDERCRLVVVLGMGGMGKTVLVAKFAQTLTEEFEIILWCSLLNSLPFAEVLAEWLPILAGQPLTDLPVSLEEQFALLVGYLQKRRCLLILDNMESILQVDRAGAYRPGYEAYGKLLHQVGLSVHRSCLLLTSRERPQPVGRLERDMLAVHTLVLRGLLATDAHQLVTGQGLIAEAALEETLIKCYSGNPLALKLVSMTVQELFGGDLAAFFGEAVGSESLEAIPPIFDDIRWVLDQQWSRLSPLEQEITTWLVVMRQPVTAQVLREYLLSVDSHHAFVAALRALQRRSLLEHQDECLTLQNVVMEYITEHLIEQVCNEIETECPNRLQRVALTQAIAEEHIRESQVRMILQPVAERLIKTLGVNRLQEKAHSLLNQLRDTRRGRVGYAGGNLLNLLLLLGLDLGKADFSGLAIWQADLRTAILHNVNFAGVNFRGTTLRDTFGVNYCVAFSPDGRFLAMGTSDFQLRLWDMAAQRCCAVLEGHTQYVWTVAFHPQGHVLASGSLDGSVRLWDVQRGECLQILLGHTQGIRQVAFSPNGETLASASPDGTIRVWDVASVTCRSVLSGHVGGVTAVAFSPNGRWLITGGDDADLRLWNVQSGYLLRRFSGHTNLVHTVAFSADGRMIASGSSDYSVRLWDADSGELLITLVGHTDTVYAVAFYQAGKMLVSGGADRILRLWDTASGQCTQMLNYHTSTIWAIAASADERFIASVSDDKTVRVWNATKQRVTAVLQGYTGAVGRLVFANNGALLAAAGADGDIHLWNMENYQHLDILPGHHGNTRALVIHAASNLLASAGDDSSVQLWDMWRQQRVATLRGHTKTVRTLAFHPDGVLLASAGDDLTICLWDVRSQTKVATLANHQLSIWALAFSPDQALLASVGMDPDLKLWDVRSLELVQSISTGVSGNRALAFTRDGRQLAIGSDDGTLRLWDVRTGKVIHQLYGHTQMIRALAFHEDGKKLVSAGYDKTICVWHFQEASMSLETPQTLTGHTNAVLAAAFHPSRPLIASCGMDKTLKLWDEQSSACLVTLRTLRPYEGMNISEATGLTMAQRRALKALGAVES